jgi:N-formylglutamate deformylase
MPIEPFNIIQPTAKRVPILISVPHSGILFPDDIKDCFLSEMIESPDDTDWFVDKLYDFAPAMGITMITAKYSRWAIDLNRNTESKPLYDDGRIITELCPTATFAGEQIYLEGDAPDEIEIARRVEEYYNPYHAKIEELLKDLKKEFGYVLLWDAHSIRQYVPLISKEKFPDLILGDNDEKTADSRLTNIVLSILLGSGLKTEHNFPFKGGQITRSFGKPEDNQYALQLEMTKVNYMDNAEMEYDIDRAGKIKLMLQEVFEALITHLPQVK